MTASPSLHIKPVSILHFCGLLHCDDVSVVFDTPAPRHGLVMLRQFQTAWTAYWTDMREAEHPVDRFLALEPAQLVESFVWGTPAIVTRERNKEHANLMHLIAQVSPILKAKRQEVIYG